MIKRIFLNDKFILLLILINALVIFAIGFDLNKTSHSILNITDNLISVLFILELVIKLKEYGFKIYLSSNWNKFDFILITLSTPSLIAYCFNLDPTNISFLLIFRVLRIFKSFRFLKFIPDVNNLIKGIQRAIKASVLVLIGFFIYIFIIGVLSFYIFKSIAPEIFNTPLNSLYTIFKIFTIEGWYEIPEQITKDLSPTFTFFTNIYFIFILITGGIFGLSLVNSIFVDAMVSDNNDQLEDKIDNLEKKITELLTQTNKQNGIPK